MAVGMIFGLTTDSENDNIFGSDLWIGPTLDLDDVIKSLEDTIAVLSDVRGFGREHEYRIAVINNAGTPDYDLDDLAPKLDAADHFNGLMSRIPFGSTSATRFGANVVKNENEADGDASDAA